MELQMTDAVSLNAEIGEGDLVGANVGHRLLVFNLLLKGSDEGFKFTVEL